MQEEVLNLIFDVCKCYDIEIYGKHMAIHIMDRYWSKLYWNLLSKQLSAAKLTSSSIMNVGEIVLRKVCDAMASQIKLAVAVCIQIASKVDLYKTCLSLSQVMMK